MDYRLLVDTAVLAGEIMLGSGAEAYRVEDTISHFLKKAKLKHAQAYVTTTGIIATLSDPSIDAITVVRRIEARSTNLNKIYMVNDISRRFYNEELNLEEAFHKLKEMRYKKQYPDYLVKIGIILTTSFFTLLLGGTLTDCLVSAVIGAILAILISIGKAIHLNGFIHDGIDTAIVAFLVLMINYFLPAHINTDLVIIGAIMPMVPGVAITNAIRDTLQGDYVSGSARMLEAFVEAAAIALGAGMGISAFSHFIG